MKWILSTIALLILGLVFKLGLLVYAMYVLLGVLFLSRFFTQSWIEKISVTRRCDREVLEMGDSVEVTVEILNKGSFTVPWMMMEDSLPREAIIEMPQRIKAEGQRICLARLKSRQSVTLDYSVKFLMRGYYQLGPLLLESGDVFGLHRRFRLASEPHFALVLPKVLPLQGYNIASRRPLGEIKVMHRLFEDPTRLAGVRPYQQGDPINRIHWRATARTGAIHSRLFENSRVAGATFLLDFHTRSFDSGASVAAAELAIVTVASLANAVFLTRQQIGFASNGRDAADRIREEGWTAEFLTRADARRRALELPPSERLRPVRIENGKGGEKMMELLKTLARLEHTDGLEFSEMISIVLPRLRRDSTIIPVLRNVSENTAMALGELARRGFMVSAVVITSQREAVPDWAKPPEWADLLLSQGIDFRIVTSEESVMNLCAEAFVR